MKPVPVVRSIHNNICVLNFRLRVSHSPEAASVHVRVCYIQVQSHNRHYLYNFSLAISLSKSVLLLL